MSSSKAGQSPENQIALPTDKLYAAAQSYFNNGNGEHSQMQKALEVGTYFLSGCMAYGALRPDVLSRAADLLTSGSTYRNSSVPPCI